MANRKSMLPAILSAAVWGVASAPASGPTAAPPPGVKRLNPRILGLPDNTWLRMNPPREPDGRNYSGCCWGDWGRGGRIWYWGGGHFSYDGNDVEFYDLAANTWTRSYPPEHNPWGAKRRWVVSPREGSPTARHTYQQVCWWPERKVFFLHSGRYTWEFDPVKVKWTAVAGELSRERRHSPRPQGIQNVHCFYSPDLAAPVSVLTTGERGVYVYEAGKGWKKRKGTLPASTSWNEMYSTYVPPWRAHLVSQRKEPFMWTYEARTNRWKSLPGVPGPVRGTQALGYDSANGVVVTVAPSRKRAPLAVWILDVRTMKWREMKPTGAVPRGTGRWAPLWYDPDHNAFFFLNRTGQRGCETWVYRYRRAGAPREGAPGQGPPAATPPAPPQERKMTGALVEPKGRILFEDHFADLRHWRHEGAGRMILDAGETGAMRLEIVGSRQGGPGSQAFCLEDFPDHVAVEYDLKVLTRNGLVITFIAMKGINGEDMFCPQMPPRKGVFSDYVRNPRLRSYHVSVSRYDDEGRHTGVSNWRRNPGLHLMGQGPDLCREINRWYRIRIVKDGPHCQLGVNGILAHEFIDPGKLETPMPDSGKVGFRAIGREVRALIRNFRVRALDESRSGTR